MIAKIPFEVVELENNSYHIVVDGKIDDTNIFLIVDSGASRTIIDKCYADKLEKLNNELEEPIATGIAAEQIPVELFNIPCLTLGDLCFENIQTLTADLSAINEVYDKLTGKRIGGLIGCDFLLLHTKSIDFKKKHLSIAIKK